MSEIAREFESLNVHKDTKEMIYIICANRIDELEKDNGMKDHYIQILEGFIRAHANDMAAFIVANKIKSPRVNAREKQNDKK